jgi:hypothetical protein
VLPTLVWALSTGRSYDHCTGWTARSWQVHAGRPSHPPYSRRAAVE